MRRVFVVAFWMLSALLMTSRHRIMSGLDMTDMASIIALVVDDR